MSTSIRYYIVDDDDNLKEIPKKHIQELKARTRKIEDLADEKVRLAEVLLDMVFRTPVNVISDHYELLHFDQEGFLDQKKMDLELVYFSKIMHGKCGSDFWDSWCTVTRDAEEAAERLGIDLYKIEENVVVSLEEVYSNMFRWGPEESLRRRIHAKALGGDPKKRWEALGADIDLDSVWQPQLDNPFLEGGGPYRTADNEPLGGIYLFDGGHHRETRYYRGGYLVDEYSYPKVAHGFFSKLHNYWNQILANTMAWGTRENGEVVWMPQGQQPGQLSKLHASLHRVIEGRQPLICLTEAAFNAEAELDSTVEESLRHTLLRAHNTRFVEVSEIPQSGHIIVSRSGDIPSHLDVDALEAACLLLDRNLVEAFGYYLSCAEDIRSVCKMAKKLSYRDLLDYWLAISGGPITGQDRLLNCLLTGVPIEHIFNGLYGHSGLEERLFRERKMLVRLGDRLDRAAKD